MVEELAADQRIVHADAAQQEMSMNIPACLDLHDALQNRLIKHLLLRHAQKKQGIGYVHVRDVKALMRHTRSGVFLHLPFGIEVRREYDFLVLGRRKQSPRAPQTAVRDHQEASAVHPETGMRVCDIRIPGRVLMEAQKLSLSFDFVEKSAVHFGDSRTVYMDHACMMPPLMVRTPQPGDRIQPLGMSGMKKLKDYFIDRKIPVRLRGQIPLLVDSRSVIWVAGQVLSERVKITDKTTKVLRIEITEII
jgi:tRNA(Ile)-lysidine synthase